MAGWSNPSTLAVFVVGIALLVLDVTGGLVRFTPLIRHTGEKLSPFAIKAVAALGVLCLIVSGGIALATTSPPTSPTPTPSPPPPSYVPPSPSPSPPETTSTPVPTSPTTSPPDTSTLPLSPDSQPDPTVYLSDLPPLGSPNGLNGNPGLSINAMPYTHSIAVACVTEDAGVTYNVAGYASLHATVGVGDNASGPGLGEDVACEVTISNNAKSILKTVTIKPSDGPRSLDVSLKGARQIKIACVPVSKTKAGYYVNYEVGFGNAELKK